MGIAVPTSEESGPEKSLAMMIKAQFTEYDVYNVIGHTEIPARHVPAMVTLLTLQRIMEILATQEPNEDIYGDTMDAQEAYEEDLDKYRLNVRIRVSEESMLATILYGWTFFYGLCMRSKDRKIREEGVRLAQSRARASEEGRELGGISSKIAKAMGLGKLTKSSSVYG